MEISLLDCVDSDIDRSCEKVYDKIYRCAKDLLRREDIEKNTAFHCKQTYLCNPHRYFGGCFRRDPVQYAKTLDKAARL